MAHPHRLVSQARHALARKFDQLTPGSHVLLAVSGGADSMALAGSAVYAARRNEIQLHSLTVDHSVRPESSSEAAHVAQQLKKMGIDARVAHVALGCGNGPEGDARTARYSALAREARRLWRDTFVHNSSWAGVPVFLGHNADEQAETVLLGLARGSGARSIAGMPEHGSLPEHSDVPMVRPLLDMSRSELRTVCRELGITWVDDPTNSPDSQWRAANGDLLMRSAIRHEIMPSLTRVFGSGVVRALVRTGKLARADEAALSELAEKLLLDDSVCERESSGSGRIALCVKRLAEQPPAIRTRALRAAAVQAGARSGELFLSHVAALDKLVEENKNNVHIDLPGASAWKHHGTIVIEPRHLPGPSIQDR